MTGEERILALPPPVSIVVAVAINGHTKSKYVIRWALEKFGREENVVFKLLHVHQPIVVVPTPMGNFIPISQVRDVVAAAYKQEIEWQTSEKLAPYLKMFARNKVQVDVVMLESDDVVSAISGEIASASINKLVIGASSTSMFARKRQSLSSKIAELTPSSCTVYAVSKGKLVSVRPSDAETNGSIAETSSTMSFSNSSSGSSMRQDQSFTDQSSVGSYSHSRSPSLPQQRFQALAMMNQTLLPVKPISFETDSSKCQSFNIKEEEDAVMFGPSNSDVGSVQSEGFSGQTSIKYGYGESCISDQASSSDSLRDFSPNDQDEINLELEKLRIELRHFQGMYAVAQNEKIDASRKLSDLSKRHSEEANKLKELHDQEEKAKEIAREEKQKYEAAKREAEVIRKRAEKEAEDRRNAEAKAQHDAQEKERLENALVNTANRYLKFSWEEIVAATLSFSEDLIIGRGANGTVYKGTLHSTISAVKVLHSNEGRGTKQFQQELEILSKIRHPHLLLLLGACTDHGCIVYEYMENGSLAARLQCQNDTPPIPWSVRFRIAWEIASALVFLHSTKPNPIIHRDLKPANILLDCNFVSKIGDVGLSTMLHKNDPSYLTAMYTDTGPVGTLCYIDPEYQRTGEVSAKSDVYAFGMVLLQLLTGKQAMALAHTVETALNDGNLTRILDPKAGMWPIEETKELAMLGLRCVEMRRVDRPDLEAEVLPKLERLKDAACKQQVIKAPSTQLAPPNHFICPLLEEIMEEPCVAADGYTYDRKGIEKWLQKNDNSPKTNLPLPHKHLLPNFTLLSAITEWKSKI